MVKNSKVIKASYFANWADIFGFPLAYKLIPLVLPFKFITPNVVTVAAFILYTFGCLSLFLNYPYHLYIAAFLMFAGYIGDDLDGQLARVRGLSSKIGDFLDKVLDVLKMFIITASLSWAVYLQTHNILYIYLGFISCFFFMYRYYIKLETMYSAFSSDSKYFEKSDIKRKYLQEEFDNLHNDLSKTLMGRIKSFWLKNRIFFFIDEAEFVVVIAVGAIINRLDVASYILALSQVVIVIWRLFERGYQLHTNSEDLLKPMRK